MSMLPRQTDHDGHTIWIEHCAECPRLWDWPAQNLITGRCPRCGKDHPQAWRFAVARRIMARRLERNR